MKEEIAKSLFQEIEDKIDEYEYNKRVAIRDNNLENKMYSMGIIKGLNEAKTLIIKCWLENE